MRAICGAWLSVISWLHFLPHRHKKAAISLAIAVIAMALCFPARIMFR